MTPRNCEKRIHVGWITKGVNGNDCPGLVRDRLFNPLWIQVESDWININKDGACSHIADRIGHGDEGERRHNYLVPRSYLERQHAKGEAGGSPAYADGGRRTRVNGDRALKFFELGAQAQT